MVEQSANGSEPGVGGSVPSGEALLGVLWAGVWGQGAGSLPAYPHGVFTGCFYSSGHDCTFQKNDHSCRMGR